MYIVSIVVTGMSKAPKKLSNCLKRAETSVVLVVFDCVLCEVSAYKLLLQFFTVAQHESGTRKLYLGQQPNIPKNMRSMQLLK